MREILFRGKRMDNLGWVEGYLLKECNYGTCSWNLGIEYKTDRFGQFAYEVAEVVPYTVGQFTGLTDKNGKKIFEGDIVNCISSDYIGHPKTDQIIVKDMTDYNTMVYLNCSNELEVIGNIHDNPELLENP